MKDLKRSDKWSINSIKRAAESAGSEWFDPDLMRLFRSRILNGVYDVNGRTLFVSSEKCCNFEPRCYTIREFVYRSLNDVEINTVGEFQAYETAYQAKKAVRNMMIEEKGK